MRANSSTSFAPENYDPASTGNHLPLVERLIADFDDKAHFLGDRDELGGRHQAALLVRPSQQRLAGLDSPGLQIIERLIVEFEVFAFGRAAQIKFESPARLCAG